MKRKLIEQRIIKTIYCDRERKFADKSGDTPEIKEIKAEKRKCHLGLLELNGSICGSCIWFGQENFNDGTNRAAVTDREITREEAEKLRLEYHEKNREQPPMPLMSPGSVFSLTHKEMR